MMVALRNAGYQVMGISRQTLHTPDLPAPTELTEIALDLSQADAIQQWLNSQALKQFLQGASQALLINNAGQIAPIAPVGHQGANAIASAIALNVSSALILSDAFIAATENCRQRRILHVSSGAARSAYPGWSVYCASKAALDHHARAVAAEKHPNLRISSVAPGVIDTDMQAEIRATHPDLFPMKQKFDDLKRQGLLASPEQAGDALVRHLLSESFGLQACEDVRNC
jgi:NAD(P)-dependent dehydrogenase (short-subunit alcohol dehydrogenase family)